MLYLCLCCVYVEFMKNSELSYYYCNYIMLYFNHVYVVFMKNWELKNAIIIYMGNGNFLNATPTSQYGAWHAVIMDETKLSGMSSMIVSLILIL